MNSTLQVLFADSITRGIVETLRVQASNPLSAWIRYRLRKKVSLPS